MSGDLTSKGGGSASNNKNSGTDPLKRPTFAEKLMSVRNSQCDLHLFRSRTAIDALENRRLVRIREDTNKVRYDFKGMEVDKKKRELEEKKTRWPSIDTEEDEFEIARAQRYLFYNPNQCFYMDKKNQLPLRGRAKSDPYQVTPTIARARKIMQDMVNDRAVDQMKAKRATMMSRKSTRSVRFRQDQNDDDVRRVDERKRPKSMEVRKSRSGATPRATEVSGPQRSKTASHAQTLSRQQQLLAHLRRSKHQQHTTSGDVDEVDAIAEIPDDFQHLQLQQQGRLQLRSDVMQRPDGEVFTQSVKPGSNYGRRSQGVTMQAGDTESELYLPSLTSGYANTDGFSHFGGDTTTIVDSQVGFGASEELPPHEVDLLRAARKPEAGKDDDVIEVKRMIKSALVQSRPLAKSAGASPQRRFQSTSANPRKRRQLTHALLRQEQLDVDAKIDRFLSKFDDAPLVPGSSRPRAKTAMHRPSMATIPVQPVKGSERQSRQTVAGEGQTKSNSVHWQQPETTSTTPAAAVVPEKQAPAPAAAVDEAAATPRTPRGVPHYAQARAMRHTASFKLKRMVEELLRKRTTAQMFEYEKMRAARAAGAKTPDIQQMLAAGKTPEGYRLTSSSKSPAAFRDLNQSRNTTTTPGTVTSSSEDDD